MAGDWIAFECATLEKPEVYKLARMLGVGKGDAILLLLTFWTWVDRNSEDGTCNAVVTQDVDTIMHCPGFASAMKAIGWLELDDANERIVIPGFGKHHGKSAKKRLLTARRVAQHRNFCNVKSNADDNADRNAGNVTKALTTEQKSLNTAADAALIDPRKQLFDLGVRILTGHGNSESSSRSFLASQAKNGYGGEAKLAEVLAYLATHPKIEPKGYIVAAMKPPDKAAEMRRKLALMP